MSKQLQCFDEELRSKSLNASRKLAKIVGSTLGPRGRNVILHGDGRSPIITKDGITISRVVQFDDPAEQTAASIIKQAAESTSNDAGDGTTTTTVLADAILQQASKHIARNVSPVEIKKGIDLAVRTVVTEIEQVARSIETIEDVENVATISANNDKVIGKLVAKAIEAAGRDGVVTIEESRSVETTIDALEGFRFDSGYLSNAFITDERRKLVRYENVRVMVTDYDLSEAMQIKNAAELIARDNKPLLVIANEVEGKALAALVANALRGSLKVVAVKAPRYGEERRDILEDLAIATGAKYFRRDKGDLLEDIQLIDFGIVKTIEIDKHNTTLIGTGGKQEAIEQRLADIKALYEAATEPVNAEMYHQRMIRMNGGVVVIRVGGSTEVEMIEKKHRIEDALEAVKAAQALGVVPGGGCTLAKIACNLQKSRNSVNSLITKEQQLGYYALLEACYAPILKMVENAGLKSYNVIPHLLRTSKRTWYGTKRVDTHSPNLGYDFLSEEFVDMYSKGIIDPAKVVIFALRNAASAASALLTADVALIEEGKE